MFSVLQQGDHRGHVFCIAARRSPWTCFLYCRKEIIVDMFSVLQQGDYRGHVVSGEELHPGALLSDRWTFGTCAAHQTPGCEY